MARKSKLAARRKAAAVMPAGVMGGPEEMTAEPVVVPPPVPVPEIEGGRLRELQDQLRAETTERKRRLAKKMRG